MRTVITGAMFATGLVALAGQADAQPFKLFEHRLSEIESAAVPLLNAMEPDHQPGGPARKDRSLREALFEPLIRRAEARYRLPPRLFQALVWAESRFDPLAISPAGAAGLAQLMPGTAKDLGISNRHDPEQSVDGGARYLRQMLDRFGAVELALAAYNAGPNAVVRAGGIPRNRETPTYVRSVIGKWMAYGAS